MNSGTRIALLKQASAAEAAGKGMGNLVGSVLRGGKSVVRAGGGVGKGLAEAAGVAPELGAALGMGAAGYGLYRGAKSGKELAQSKVDEFRIQHGLYPNVMY